MIESQYRIAQGIAYLIYFVSFVISVLLMPFIQNQVASKLAGMWVYPVTYIIAFALMFFVFPKIGTMMMAK